MLRAFLEAEPGNDCGSLRQVFSSGEALSPDLIQRFFHCISAQLHNLYGPTEAAVDVTFWPCQRAKENELQGGVVPIGKPIANIQTYILSPGLRALPLNVAGELCIGGVGLGRGYLHRPALTAEKFIPNPFVSTASENQGSRLYRTGDLVRFATSEEGDTNIEFLGRIDHQVKLRGFRIELGEIESALGQHPEIFEVVALLRQDPPGQKLLVAYITSKTAKLSSLELRRYLEDQLPDYMIPSRFIQLESIPQTPNGKVDRRALPAPDAPTREGGGPIPPRDLLELKLVQIWEDLLKVHPLGIANDFFEMGGHSLLAVALTARIEREWGCTLPLSALFQGRTIQTLAPMIHQDSKPHESPLVDIQPQGDRQPLFLIHPIGGNILCYLELAKSLGRNQPVYALQSPLLYGDSRFTKIEDLADLFIDWIQRVQPRGPYQIGGWSSGGVVAFEMARQLTERGFPVALLALMDSHLTFRTKQEIDGKRLLAAFISDLGGLYGEDLYAAFSTTDDTDEESQLEKLWQFCRNAELLPESFQLPQMQRLWRVFRQNALAIHAYQPKPYCGTLTYFRAVDSVQAQGTGEKKGVAASDQPSNNGAEAGVPGDVPAPWRHLSANPIPSHDIPGTHHSLMQRPGICALAEKLNLYLLTDAKKPQ